MAGLVRVRCPECNSEEGVNPKRSHPLAPPPVPTKPGRCKWCRGKRRIRTGLNTVRKCAGCDGTGVCPACKGTKFIAAASDS